MSKLVQAAKTIGKEVDKGTKKLDTNISKAIGMEEGHKISHTLNVDSDKHKEAVKDLKAQTTEATYNTSAEEHKAEAQLGGENGQNTDES